ncbi:DUF5723 family protein [uncultured Formosa sp.]|uniref:DUF5723 family protein n=1 Tax=uncultured Formosa sp. TaxID=255435 RepID=UPI00260A120F|nr:DUF5723 family protein [uncultured Formosa sp.]
MKPLPILLTLVFFTSICNTIKAQNYIGHTVDNYAGIHSVIYNPATSVGSKMKLDINILSLSSFGANDYYAMTLNNLVNSENIFSSEQDTKTFPKDNNNFFVNLDVMGPSIMLNINKSNSVALISRVRSFVNINKINGELFENIKNDFDETENFNFKNDEFTGAIHAWAELGFSYGHILYNNKNHKIKGGITLKYLQGIGSAFMSTNELKGNYNASANTLETTGNLVYGVTGDFDIDNLKYENLGTGFGADIGLIYEWIKNNTLDDLNTDYKLKIGVSVTDIGSINYKDTEVSNYDLNATINPNDFDIDNLDDLYEYTSVIEKAKIKLPTAIHLQADYNIVDRFYMSAQADFSIAKANQAKTSNSLNSVIFTPRFEIKRFSVYLPFGFRQYGGFGSGFGLRAGPLTIGSSSIISNLISNTSKSADVYIGLKVPIYR